MKFSEMPYTRPNLEEIRKNSEAILQRLASAACAQEQVDAYMDFEALQKELRTDLSLAYIRHTVDTRDTKGNQSDTNWKGRSQNISICR